jgi:hypothetical protein
MERFTTDAVCGARPSARPLALGALLAVLAMPAWADTKPAESLCARPSTPEICRDGVPVPVTVRGSVEGAAGIEDRALILRTKDGGVLSVWCKDKCQDAWFVTHEPGTSVTLAPALFGRKATVVVTRERNVGRIAGEEDDAEFLFIQRITLQK